MFLQSERAPLGGAHWKTGSDAKRPSASWVGGAGRAKRGGRNVTCERSELRFASCSERMGLDLLDPAFLKVIPCGKVLSSISSDSGAPSH